MSERKQISGGKKREMSKCKKISDRNKVEKMSVGKIISDTNKYLTSISSGQYLFECEYLSMGKCLSTMDKYRLLLYP